MMTSIEVLSPGPLATIQDLGRPGMAHVGVPLSGAADRLSMRLANRLVGNEESAAVIEATLGGFALRARRELVVAVTGAHAQVTVDDKPVGLGALIAVAQGAVLAIASPQWGARNYVAVRGGIDVPAVLGSRSTDTLSGLGPRALQTGDTLAVGAARSAWPSATIAPLGTDHHHRVVDLDTLAGPRRDRVKDPTALFDGVWECTAEADRVGIRVRRPNPDSPNDAGAEAALEHRDNLPELLSEGLAHGSVQVPPGGQPVIFLADHPVTGGYPVVAVLTESALARAAQLVAGNRVRFRSR